MILNLPNFKPVCQTNGRGLWSNVERKVFVSKALVEIYLGDEENPNYGLIDAYFSKKSWNTDVHGLIYTDPLWLKDFRSALVGFGFFKSAAGDVDYTEQGMQGSNYVSLCFGKKFLKEVKKMFDLNGDWINRL